MEPVPRVNRAVASPQGVPFSTLFYAHDPATREYKDASKIKCIDVHPVHPWLLSADEAGNVVVWDYEAESIVLTFSPEATKEAQRQGVEALEAHSAFASTLGAVAPDLPSTGLGVGVAGDAGAAAGGVTEAFVSSVIAGAKKRLLLERLPDDVRAGRAGAVRGVRFADEHVLALSCGAGRGQYEDVDASGSGMAAPASVPLTLAASVDEALAAMAALGGGGAGAGTTAGIAGDSWGSLASALSPSSPFHANAAGALRVAPRPAPSWIIVMCESRVMLMDYATLAVTDIPHTSLLVEATLPSPLLRAQGRGRPGVHSAASLGPGIIAFGCDDGAIRVWSVDSNAVIQVVRPAGGASWRAITHLHVFSTQPCASGSTNAALAAGAAAGSTAASASAAAGRVLLLAGAADGSINAWEVMGGRQVVDYGRGGGIASFKLSSDLVDLSLCPITMTAVALAADKTVFTWDASGTAAVGAAAPGAGAGGAGAASGASAVPIAGAAAGLPPRMLSSRLATSSTSSETGAGSKMLSAVCMGAHPAFPPTAVLAASKGPHLELSVIGSADKAAESGIIAYDVRSGRAGLPPKCKVYAMARHPFRPDIIACGANIGVFVVQVAAAPTAATLCVTHPLWRSPGPALCGGSTAGIAAGGSSSARSRRDSGSGCGDLLCVAESAITVYATASGALVAGEVQLSSAASAEDALALLHPSASSSAAHVASGSAGIGGPIGGPMLMSSDGLGLVVREHTLLPSLAPPVLPPPTAAPLASMIKPGPGSAGLPAGGRGVRLRVSGSGHYVSAVWPDAKCYAIYRLAFGSRVAGSNGLPASDAAAAAAVAGGKPWFAELVETGSGVDVAWSGAGHGHGLTCSSITAAGSFCGVFVDVVRLPAPAAEAGDGEGGPGAGAASPRASDSPTGLPAGLTYAVHAGADRYVVLEPGIPVAVKKVYGGGMPIGAQVPGKGPGAGAGKDGKRGGAAGGGGSGASAGASPHFPNTMSLRQLPVPKNAHADDTPRPSVLLAQVPLPQEPLAVWGGGPALAIALASDTGAASASLQASLATASLQFFAWEIATPPPLPDEDKEKDKGKEGVGGAYAAAAAGLQSITAKARELATKPRMPLISTGAATPAPSLAGVLNNCGVCWDAAGARLAVLTASFAHIFALVSAAPGTASGGAGGSSSGASSSAAAYTGASTSVIELCRVNINAAVSSAAWLEGGMLAIMATDAAGSRLLGVLPPVADAACGATAAAVTLNRGATRAQPLLLELAALLPPPAVDASLLASPLPLCKRSPCPLAMAAPLCAVRGHLLLANWAGLRGWLLPGAAFGSGASGAAPPALGSGIAFGAVPLHHPGLRAAVAASCGTSLAARSSLTGGLASIVAPPSPRTGSAASHAAAAAATAAALAPATSMQSYLAAAASAASWGALLPPEAQGGLAFHLASLGAPAAALLLPCLPPAIGIGIALRTRGEAFTTATAAATRAASVSAGSPSSSAAPQLSLLPLADGLVATNYLLVQLLGDAAAPGLGEEDLLLLAAPDFHDARAGRFAPGAVEGTTGAVGVWPQVSAFLGLAAVAFPHLAASCREAVATLAERLRSLGQASEALLVGSLLPRVAVHEATSLSVAPAPLTSVDLVVAALRDVCAMTSDGSWTPEALAFSAAI